MGEIRLGGPAVVACRLARSKNGKPHDVPLSAQVMGILQSLPRFTGGGMRPDHGRRPYGVVEPLGGKGKQRLDTRGLPPEFAPWRLHDLRRSVASGMARIELLCRRLKRSSTILSGSFAGIVGVYQRHDFAEEKRVALERWSAHVMRIVSGKPADVLPLHRRQQ